MTDTLPAPHAAPGNAAASRSFCIVMLSAAGDAVHVLPVINAIKRAEPASRIAWVLQPGPASLVRGHPLIDEIIPFDRSRGWRAFTDVRRRLRACSFDVTLALQDYLKAGVITSFSGAPIRLGYNRARARDANWLFTNRQIPPHQPQHIQDEYLEFVQALGIAGEPVQWGLGPWNGERAWQRDLVSRLDRPIASLVIGSSRAEKDWVAERWAEVADALYEGYGMQPVLVGGQSPRETATAAGILAHARHAPESLLGSGLRKLVSILDASALVVSLDTGPLHVAVALDRPVISLIGYSNPLRTGPYRRFQDLLVNAYGDTMRGGQLATDRRTGRMRGIRTRDVLDRVARWAEHYRGA